MLAEREPVIKQDREHDGPSALTAVGREYRPIPIAGSEDRALFCNFACRSRVADPPVLGRESQ